MKRSAPAPVAGDCDTLQTTLFKKMQTDETRLQTRLQNVIDRENAVCQAENVLLARSKQQDERDRYLNQLNHELHERTAFMREQQHAFQMQYEHNKYTKSGQWVQ